KVYQLILLCRTQITIVVNDAGGFVGVTKNGLVTRVVLAIMHQLVARAYTPKRSSAQLVFHGLVKLTSVGIIYLRNAIPRAHIMEEKVTVRMDDLVSQRVRDREGPTID